MFEKLVVVEEEKKQGEFPSSDPFQAAQNQAAAQTGTRRRAIANKMGGDENYIDYLLTVAEERHRNHLITRATDIRFSVKESYQQFFR